MAKKIAFSSIMTALTMVCLYGSILLPTGRIALLVLTSLFVLITHAECGTRYSVMHFLSSSILGALFLPFKAQWITFAAFLGYYPIIKSYIEQIRIAWLEWVVKFLFFNAILIIAYFVIKYILLTYITLGPIFNYVLSHLLAVVFVAEITFILYDYMLSWLASYYVNTVSKKINKIIL